MRKAKSRNFILVVLGVFIMLLLGFVFAKTMINVINELSIKDVEKELQQNIISSSSQIKLKGKGNFINNSPRIDGTNILDFNVKMENMDDYIFYSINFCNMNNEDLKYSDLVIDGISCTDVEGNNDCNSVVIDSYLLKKNNKLQKNTLVPANSCVDLVVEANYIGDVSKDVEVYISKISLNLLQK